MTLTTKTLQTFACQNPFWTSAQTSCCTIFLPKYPAAESQAVTPHLTYSNFITVAATIESSHLRRYGFTMNQNLLNKKIPLSPFRYVLPVFYLEMSHCTVPLALQQTPREAAESNVYLRAVFSMRAFTVNHATPCQREVTVKRSEVTFNMTNVKLI